MAYNVFALGEQGEENTNVEQGWNKPGGGPTQFRGDPKRCGGGKKKRPREARGRRQVQVVEIKIGGQSKSFLKVWLGWACLTKKV
jgi:hypothetical protein